MESLDFKKAVDEITTAAKWLRENGAPKVTLKFRPEHLTAMLALSDHAVRYSQPVASRPCIWTAGGGDRVLHGRSSELSGG